MHKALFAIGLVIAVMGAFWACQGGGIIKWPASSFMVDKPEWANYGALTAVAGLAIMWLSLRIK